MSEEQNEFHMTREDVKEIFATVDSESSPFPRWKEFVYETKDCTTRANIAGKFTADELLAIVWCMKNRVANYCIVNNGR